MQTLREIIRTKHARQRTLAKLLGVSEPTMSCWANRQRRIPASAVVILAEELDVSLAEILAVSTPIAAEKEAA